MAEINELNLEHYFLGGTSVGGWLAQFMIKFDEKIKGIILANTFCTNEYLRNKNKLTFNLARLLPGFITFKIFKKGVIQSINNYEIDSQNYILNCVDKLDKFELISRLSWSLENIDYPVLDPELKKLIIYSEDDPVLGTSFCKQITNCYPNADTFVIREGGHFPYLSDHCQEYAEKIFEFIQTTINVHL